MIIKCKRCLVSLVLVISFMAATTVFAANKTQIKATKINIFRPETAMPKKKKRGFCWMHAVAITRPDAWRCMVGGEIRDPCFVLETKDAAVCGVDPTKEGKSGFLLKLNKPLPNEAQNSNLPLVNAWVVQLEEGLVCTPYTGAMPIIKQSDDDITAIQYGCESAGAGFFVGLMHDSVVPGKIWRAKKVVYSLDRDQKAKINKIQDVVIKEVWQ